jgi:hypothetical protein
MLAAILASSGTGAPIVARRTLTRRAPLPSALTGPVYTEEREIFGRKVDNIVIDPEAKAKGIDTNALVAEMIQKNNETSAQKKHQAWCDRDMLRPDEHMFSYTLENAGDKTANATFHRTDKEWRHDAPVCVSPPARLPPRSHPPSPTDLFSSHRYETEDKAWSLSREMAGGAPGWIVGNFETMAACYGCQCDSMSVPMVGWQAFSGEQPPPYCDYVRCETVAEGHKAQGNVHFKRAEWLRAIECYGEVRCVCAPPRPRDEATIIPSRGRAREPRASLYGATGRRCRGTFDNHYKTSDGRPAKNKQQQQRRRPLPRRRPRSPTTRSPLLRSRSRCSCSTTSSPTRASCRCGATGRCRPGRRCPAR